jgi:hypothetical protein
VPPRPLNGIPLGSRSRALAARVEPLYGLDCQESVRILSRLFLAFSTLSFLVRMIESLSDETVVERLRIEAAF